jgi:glycosyltransferase involved in cell wall biosynthesis
MELSIVSPVYKAVKILPELIKQLQFQLLQITVDYEIVLVEDGGQDGSWETIEMISLTDNRVKGIKLSRNFGQHYAITAGIENAKGKWVVVMDCDLQDRPEEIPLLYKKALEGNEIVLAKRTNRTDNTLKKASSRFFYGTLTYLTGTYQDPSIANFGIYSRKVIDAVNRLREPIRYFPTMVNWVGFNKAFIYVEHGDRFEGGTSYNWRRLFKLALDIILANSDKPIRLIIKLGFLISFSSILIGLVILVRYFLGQITVPGYTSLLVSIWFIGGAILFVLGLVGLYIGKIFEGVKNRPLYITQSKVNFDD